MVQKCPKCNNLVDDKEQFCPHCGEYLKEINPSSKNKKVIIISVLVVICLIVAALLYFVVFSNKEISKEDLLGTWKGESLMLMGNEVYYTFYENNSVKITTAFSDNYGPSIAYSYDYQENTITINSVSKLSGQSEMWQSYELKGDKICFEAENDSNVISIGDSCLPYEYDGTTISISFFMIDIDLTRSELPEIQPTSNLVKWEDINITINDPIDFDWNWINLTRSDVPYSGDHCPAEWGYVTAGDTLEIGQYTENIDGYIIYIPNDETIDSFYL